MHMDAHAHAHAHARTHAHAHPKLSEPPSQNSVIKEDTRMLISDLFGPRLLVTLSLPPYLSDENSVCHHYRHPT